jgi:hypothetical protein
MLPTTPLLLLFTLTTAHPPPLPADKRTIQLSNRLPSQLSTQISGPDQGDLYHQ